jgi:hypothetical protein
MCQVPSHTLQLHISILRKGDYHFHFLNEATEAERGEGIQGQQCKQSSSDLFVFEAHIVLSASMGPLITGYAIEFQ